MPKILLVAESGGDLQSIADVLGREPELDLEYAATTPEALDKLAHWRPDVVIADLAEPGKEQLALIEQMHRRHPATPILLLTSAPCPQAILEALRRGAASYLPKQHLADRLLQTLAKVLAARGRADLQPRLLGCITETSSLFLLENDLSLIGPLIGYLQENLAQIGVLDPAQRMRIGLAVEEALTNAILHGNLELSSQLKDLDEQAFQALLAQRRQTPPYALRKVSLEVTLTTEEARFVITDEGPGFDPQALPDPLAPANLEKCSGRGILLMRTFMDDVRYNEKGNQVTLVKRLSLATPPPESPDR